MAIANIVHSGYGFRCTATDRALPLTLGLDGSAVLERLNDGDWRDQKPIASSLCLRESC